MSCVPEKEGPVRDIERKCAGGEEEKGINVESDKVQMHRDALVSFFKYHLQELPEPYIELDTSRISALYFCVVGLDLLNELDSISSRRVDIIEFVYAQQLIAPEGCSFGHRGFLGTFAGQRFGTCLCASMCLPTGDVSHVKTSQCSINPRTCFMEGHIAMTYTALAVLKTLGDDLSRVDKKGLVEGEFLDSNHICILPFLLVAQILLELKLLQQTDGSFAASHDCGECDMRFLFCACAISSFIGDWSGIDKELAMKYIKSCITYEGGFSLVPNGEAHGGSCYCATASLVLMENLECLGKNEVSNLIQYCIHRQNRGYQGRTEKEPDTCYSFWVGGTLDLLGCMDVTDIDSTRDFLVRLMAFQNI